MNVKTFLITGLAVSMLGLTAVPAQDTFAKGINTVEAAKVVAKKKLSHKEAGEMAQKWVQKQTYIQSGGSYENGEYRRFEYNGMTYRYLSKDIDTKKELMGYLQESVTASAAKKFIADRGIIEYKGKMAQLEADGGSLLQWDRAVAEMERVTGKERDYKLLVPVGETEELASYKMNIQYSPKIGWKISELAYSHTVDLNIPFNINPAFVFFKYLLVDAEHSKEQLIKENIFNVDQFKKGITKVEVRELKEIKRENDQVEIKATFYVELDKNYKGSLKKGENQLTFTIENTGEMEYKIVKITK